MSLRSTAFAALAMILLGAPARAADSAPDVIVSIKPLHSLVSAVMAGVGEPYLLLPDGASPHAYSLRLSDARALQDADAVFWVGEGLEAFLHDAIHTLADDAVSVEIAELPDIDLLPVREGGIWAAHHHHGAEEDHDDEHEAGHEDHEDEHEHEATHEDDDHDGNDDHHALTYDIHLWLDPAIARQIVTEAAEALARIDAEHASVYRANAASTNARLATLDAELTELLAPVHDRPFIVFHDAYAYLERHFNLTARGSIVIDPEQAPGAKRIAELRDLIAERGAVCIFSEPQFEPKMVERLAADTGIRTAQLDPIGTGIAPGPDAYAEMMRGNAEAIRGCLDVTG